MCGMEVDVICKRFKEFGNCDDVTEGEVFEDLGWDAVFACSAVVWYAFQDVTEVVGVAGERCWVVSGRLGLDLPC